MWRAQQAGCLRATRRRSPPQPSSSSSRRASPPPVDHRCRFQAAWASAVARGHVLFTLSQSRALMRRDPLANPDALIRRVYSYVAYVLGDGPDAEDVTSETFVRAIRYRSSY